MVFAMARYRPFTSSQTAATGTLQISGSGSWRFSYLQTSCACSNAWTAHLVLATWILRYQSLLPWKEYAKGDAPTAHWTGNHLPLQRPSPVLARSTSPVKHSGQLSVTAAHSSWGHKTLQPADCSVQPQVQGVYMSHANHAAIASSVEV